MADNEKGFTASPNAEEYQRFRQMLAKSGKKRGAEGAMTTAMSMMAACSDMFSYTLGAEYGREVMMQAMGHAFDEHAERERQAGGLNVDTAAQGSA